MVTSTKIRAVFPEKILVYHGILRKKNIGLGREKMSKFSDNFMAKLLPRP